MKFIQNIKIFVLKLLFVITIIPLTTNILLAHNKIAIDEDTHIKEFISGIEYFIKIYKPYKKVVQPSVLSDNLVNFGESGSGTYNAAGGSQLLIENRHGVDMIISAHGITGGTDLTKDEILKIRIAANNIIKNSEKILCFLYETNDYRQSFVLYKYFVEENSLSSQILHEFKKNNTVIDNLVESKAAITIKHVDAINTLNEHIELLYKDLILKLESIFGSKNTIQRLTKFLDLHKTNNIDYQDIKTQKSINNETIKNNPTVLLPVNDLIDNNTYQITSGNNFGDGYSQSDLWFKSNYLNYKIEIDDKTEFKQKSVTAGFGLEQQVNDYLNLGLFYNYINSDALRAEDIIQDYEIKSHHLGGNIVMLQNNNIFFDGSFNYIKNKINGEFNNNPYKNNMRLLNGIIGVGMNISLDSSWYIKPKSCIDFSHYTYDKNPTTNTTIDTRHHGVKISAECEFGGTLMVTNYLITPKIKLGISHKLGDNKDKLFFKFTNKEGEIFGYEINKNTVNIALGTNIISDNISLDINYNLILSSDSKTHSLIAKLGYLF